MDRKFNFCCNDMIDDYKFICHHIRETCCCDNEGWCRIIMEDIRRNSYHHKHAVASGPPPTTLECCCYPSYPIMDMTSTPACFLRRLTLYWPHPFTSTTLS